jgi:hypothetical protein
VEDDDLLRRDRNVRDCNGEWTGGYRMMFQ